MRVLFHKDSNNNILFWDYLSSHKWPPHLAVDKETKKFKTDSIFLCKSSWDFSKKECDIILKNWKIIFQALDFKGKNLLQSIPWRCSIEEGSEYDDTISYAKVVSVSALYSRCSSLTVFSCSITQFPYGWHIVSSWNICIYSVDTIMYPYTLPLILSLFSSSSLCLSATWALRVKVVTELSRHK